MVTVNEFLKQEVTATTQTRVLEIIAHCISSGKEKEVLDFNVYIIEIYPIKNIVLIYNDLQPDEAPAEMSLTEFYEVVKAHKVADTK